MILSYRDLTVMFTDAIEFLNNIGDTYKAFTNVKENNMDILQLTHNVVNVKHYSYIKYIGDISRLILHFVFFRKRVSKA